MKRIGYDLPILILTLAGLAFVLTAVLVLVQGADTRVRRVSTFGANPPVIIIDPGHGGADGGAVGVDNVIEDGINLEIAFILRDLFLLNGFEVVMTREEDISIHDPGVSGLRAQKTSDLRNRLAFTERYPNNIFISIHQNKFSDPSQWGAQIFYGPNHPGSAELAEMVQQNIAAMLQPDNRRQPKEGGSNLYLIDRAKSPAILVEGGFLSNRQDAANLTDPDFQAQLAFAILCSTLAYLGMELPVSLG